MAVFFQMGGGGGLKRLFSLVGLWTPFYEILEVTLVWQPIRKTGLHATQQRLLIHCHHSCLDHHELILA